MTCSTLTDGAILEKLRAVVARRRLFAEIFTPEVMEALAEFVGAKDMIFAFVGDMDPYRACQMDAKAGVLRGIAWEVEHLEEAEKELARMESQMKYQEEVHHV